jgi:2-alkenal reductase
LQYNLEQIHNKVTPSVVNINVSVRATGSQSRIPNFPNSQQTPPVQQGLGSGFVWDKLGHIVTNNHVVNGAEKITVTFSDGFSTTAKIVGQDKNSDLAVIKVDVAESVLIPVQVADSNQLKVGQLAIAIGNPFGLEGTMTMGIVSALGRSLPVESTTANGATYSIPDIIQTDAPINPGNSGGVLVNDVGQVIGVTSAIESPVQASVGIGYAVPSAIVQRVVPALIKNGKYSYPWLGISGTEINSDIVREMQLNPETRGVLVGEITKGSPSEKAGVKGSTREVVLDNGNILVGGDIITAIDGQVVRRFNDLVGYLVRATVVGQKVNLTILRDGKQQIFQVTLAARPE